MSVYSPLFLFPPLYSPWIQIRDVKNEMSCCYDFLLENDIDLPRKLSSPLPQWICLAPLADRLWTRLRTLPHNFLNFHQACSGTWNTSLILMQLIHITDIHFFNYQIGPYKLENLSNGSKKMENTNFAKIFLKCKYGLGCKNFFFERTFF